MFQGVWSGLVLCKVSGSLKWTCLLQCFRESEVDLSFAKFQGVWNRLVCCNVSGSLKWTYLLQCIRESEVDLSVAMFQGVWSGLVCCNVSRSLKWTCLLQCFKESEVDLFITMFQGCQRVVEDWQRILQVRSLVVTPQEDMKTWLKYASLCRKTRRLVSCWRSLHWAFSWVSNHCFPTYLIWHMKM